MQLLFKIILSGLLLVLAATVGIELVASESQPTTLPPPTRPVLVRKSGLATAHAKTVRLVLPKITNLPPADSLFTGSQR